MTTSCANLRLILHDRSQAVVEGWYRAVRNSVVALHAPSELRSLLSDIWDETRAFLLLDDGRSRDAARIGASFASLGIRTKDIGAIQQVLLACLLKELPDDADRAVRARLPRLIEGLTTGFVDASEERLLEQQEEIREAYERSLRDAEHQLRVLNAGVRSSINAIAMLDLDGRVTYVNPAFLDLWGYESDREVLGRHVSRFGEWRGDVGRALQILSEQGGWSGELVAVRADRSHFDVLASVSPIQDDAGQVTQLMCFFVDVTERRRSQEALQRRARQAAFLNRIGEEIARERTQKGVLKRAVQLAQETFGFHQVAVLLLDREQGVLDVAAIASSDDLASDVGSISLGEGITGWVAQQNRTAVVDDVSADPRYTRVFPRPVMMCSEIAVPIRASQRVIGVLDVQSRTGDAFGSSERVAMETLADQIAVALENVRLYQALQDELAQRRSAEEDLVRHVRRLETVHDIDQAILVAKSMEEVAEAALSHLRQLVPCQRASIDLIDWENEQVVVLAAIQTVGEGRARAGRRFPLTHAEWLSELWARPGCVYVSNAGRLPESSPLIRMVREEGIRSFLAAPIRSREELLGLLTLGAERLDGFEPDEHGPIVREVADSVAIAIQQTRLFESVRRQRERLRRTMARLAEVEETERRRVVRELHDQVGQNLTALDLNLSLVHSQLEQHGLEQLAARLDDSFTLLEQTNERIRRLMVDLRPPVLDDYGLLSALHWYSDQFSARTGIAVDVEGKEDVAGDLPPHVENALFRIAQEALNNVWKHAQADEVTIALSEDDTAIFLTISDNGVGFAREDLGDERTSWGLLTMSERAESVGARCHCHSAPHEGTRVVVEVPA